MMAFLQRSVTIIDESVSDIFIFESEAIIFRQTIVFNSMCFQKD